MSLSADLDALAAPFYNAAQFDDPPPPPDWRRPRGGDVPPLEEPDLLFVFDEADNLLKVYE